MECRKLEITLVSAENLPEVGMKGYAKVSLKGESKTTKKSPVDKQGQTNPRWNFVVNYTVSESAVRQPGVSLVVKLFCKRSLGDRFIGEVKIQVKSLFDMGLKAESILRYSVVGTTNGRLNVLYSFGDVVFVKKDLGWKSAVRVGFLVLVGGALILLARESNDDDHDEVMKGCEGSEDVDEDDGGEVFYDACS